MGRKDPSLLITAPMGLVRKNGKWLRTCCRVNGPYIRLAFTSSAIDLRIFSAASRADEWLGGVKNGKASPVLLSLTTCGGIPWSNPCLKPVITSLYLRMSFAFLNAFSHSPISISHVILVGQAGWLDSGLFKGDLGCRTSSMCVLLHSGCSNSSGLLSLSGLSPSSSCWVVSSLRVKERL